MISPLWYREMCTGFVAIIHWLPNCIYQQHSTSLRKQNKRNTRCFIPGVITNWYQKVLHVWLCNVHSIVQSSLLPQSHNLILRLFSSIYFISHFSHIFFTTSICYKEALLTKTRSIFTHNSTKNYKFTAEIKGTGEKGFKHDTLGRWYYTVKELRAFSKLRKFKRILYEFRSELTSQIHIYC